MKLFFDGVDDGNWSHNCGGGILSDISHQVLAHQKFLMPTLASSPEKSLVSVLTFFGGGRRAQEAPRCCQVCRDLKGSEINAALWSKKVMVNAIIWFKRSVSARARTLIVKSMEVTSFPSLLGTTCI